MVQVYSLENAPVAQPIHSFNTRLPLTSRISMVGNTLYCHGDGGATTSFDLQDPTAPVQGFTLLSGGSSGASHTVLRDVLLATGGGAVRMLPLPHNSTPDYRRDLVQGVFGSTIGTGRGFLAFGPGYALEFFPYGGDPLRLPAWSRPSGARILVAEDQLVVLANPGLPTSLWFHQIDDAGSELERKPPFQVEGRVAAVALHHGVASLSRPTDTVLRYDVANPDLPVALPPIPTSSEHPVMKVGSRWAVLGSEGSLRWLELWRESSRQGWQLSDRVDLPWEHPIRAAVSEGRTIYLSNGVDILPVGVENGSLRLHPVVPNQAGWPGGAHTAALTHRGVLYVGTAVGAVLIYDLSAPSAPRYVAANSIGDRVGSLSASPRGLVAQGASMVALLPFHRTGP